jgi:hypothetical protein
LNQELTNKEIMFIRLSNLEQEYEKLLSQVQNKKTNNNEKKSFFSSFFSSSKNENNSINPLPSNKNYKTEYIHNVLIGLSLYQMQIPKTDWTM